MKVAVKDATVFIDMELMGILDVWFSLGYQTITSSFIVDEISEGQHKRILAHIDSGRISAITLETEDIIELYDKLAVSGISLADTSVLHLAIEHEALLLTGDGALRNQAKLHGLECHGSIWILDQLVKHKQIPGKVAARKLDKLIHQTGSRKRFLPIKEAQNYIRIWREMS